MDVSTLFLESQQSGGSLSWPGFGIMMSKTFYLFMKINLKHNVIGSSMVFELVQRTGHENSFESLSESNLFVNIYYNLLPLEFKPYDNLEYDADVLVSNTRLHSFVPQNSDEMPIISSSISLKHIRDFIKHNS